MVGSAIVRQLNKDPRNQTVTASRSEVDLTNQKQVDDFFVRQGFDQVYLAAAKVGGIHANDAFPAEFIYENLMIEANVIHAAHQTNVQKLLFLGSSCIYPKMAEQPMAENQLLAGPLEPTNEPYAIAKIAGIKLCESYNRQYGRDYRSVMPTNLYGPGDNYHPENSHVIPALIRRFHEAKQNNASKVVAWGTGQPRREFLYVDEVAAASEFVMNLPDGQYRENTEPRMSHINVGFGRDCTIKELTEAVAAIVGYKGRIVWDTSRPDGPQRKLLSTSRLASLGWVAEVDLRVGLNRTYEDYLRTVGT